MLSYFRQQHELNILSRKSKCDASVPFKNVRSIYGGGLLLACNLNKINSPTWVFFTFLNLYKRYQIAQNISISNIPSTTLHHWALNTPPHKLFTNGIIINESYDFYWNKNQSPSFFPWEFLEALILIYNSKYIYIAKIIS